MRIMVDGILYGMTVSDVTDTVLCMSDMLRYELTRADPNDESVIRSLGSDSAVRGRFFLNQLEVLKYCGLWNPFEAPYASQTNRSSSKKYVIFSVAVLGFFYYLFTLAETVNIIRMDDFKVADVRSSTISFNVRPKIMASYIYRMFQMLFSSA